MKYTRVSIGRDEAIRIAKSGEWKDWNYQERALRQLQTSEIMMPLGDFYEAVRLLLGRDVWSHEFMDPESLFNEWANNEPKPTMDEIIAKLPNEVIVIRS